MVHESPPGPCRDEWQTKIVPVCKEPVRAQVDAFVLDWITRDVFKREWFSEQPDGNCRLTAIVVQHLSDTALNWGRAVAPYAEWVTQTFWESIHKPSRN